VLELIVQQPHVPEDDDSDAYEMAYGGCPSMGGARLWKRQAYEMAKGRCPCEMHAYERYTDERHAYEASS
jgi:hypothetical protein